MSYRRRYPMPFPRLAKAMLRRLGVVAVRANTSAAHYILSPPQSMFDYILVRVFQTLNDINFIQIGANDGELEDPLNRYVSKFGWRGIMVEPLPDLCRKLEHKYRTCDNIKIIAAAVASDRLGRRIYQISDRADVPDFARGLATFDRQRLVDRAVEWGVGDELVSETSVPSITWDDVLSAYGQPHCEVLVIDTEGFDFEILKMIDFNTFTPRIIHFEHMLMTPAEQFAAYEILWRRSYEIATFYGNTTAWRRLM